MFIVIMPLYSQIPLMTGGGVNDLYAIMYSENYGELVKVPIYEIDERYPWEIFSHCIPIGANNLFFIYYSPEEGELFKVSLDNLKVVHPFEFYVHP